MLIRHLCCVIPGCALVCILMAASSLHAADRDVIAGVDISMLPEIDRPAVSIATMASRPMPSRSSAIITAHFFAFDLFVNPTAEFNKSYGATQDLNYVRTLSKRIKSAGGNLLLDIHYSDTWADPGSNSSRLLGKISTSMRFRNK